MFHRSKICLLLRDFLLGSRDGVVLACLSPSLETYRFAFAVMGICQKMKLAAAPKRHRQATQTQRGDVVSGGKEQHQRMVEVPRLPLPLQHDQAPQSRGDQARSFLLRDHLLHQINSSAAAMDAGDIGLGEEGASPHTASEIFDFHDILSQTASGATSRDSMERAAQSQLHEHSAQIHQLVPGQLRQSEKHARNKKREHPTLSKSHHQQEMPLTEQHNRESKLSRSHDSLRDSTGTPVRSGLQQDTQQSSQTVPSKTVSSRTRGPRSTLERSPPARGAGLSLSDLAVAPPVAGGTDANKDRQKAARQSSSSSLQSYLKNHQHQKDAVQHLVVGTSPSRAERGVPQERRRTPSKRQQMQQNKRYSQGSGGTDIYMSVMEATIVKLKESIRSLEGDKEKLQAQVRKKDMEMAKQRHEIARQAKDLEDLRAELLRLAEEVESERRARRRAENREQIARERLQEEEDEEYREQYSDGQDLADSSVDRENSEAGHGDDVHQQQVLLQRYDEELRRYIALNEQLSNELLLVRRQLEEVLMERENLQREEEDDTEGEVGEVADEIEQQGAELGATNGEDTECETSDDVPSPHERLRLENEYLRRALRQALKQLHEAKSGELGAAVINTGKNDDQNSPVEIEDQSGTGMVEEQQHNSDQDMIQRKEEWDQHTDTNSIASMNHINTWMDSQQSTIANEDQDCQPASPSLIGTVNTNMEENEWRMSKFS